MVRSQAQTHMRPNPGLLRTNALIITRVAIRYREGLALEGILIDADPFFLQVLIDAVNSRSLVMLLSFRRQPDFFSFSLPLPPSTMLCVPHLATGNLRSSS